MKESQLDKLISVYSGAIDRLNSIAMALFIIAVAVSAIALKYFTS